MNILVIGGSYFFGRVFVMLAAKEHRVTVVNRGTFSMEEFRVKQITGDRHDASVWRQCDEDYDAVVDFCAYEPGDVSGVLENLSGSVRQYIFISTVDVYQRQAGEQCAYVNKEDMKQEDAPLEKRMFQGEAGAYISGKVALEEEVRAVCGIKGIAFTILRPAILYGPYNYAPRESLFIQMAVREHLLPRFTDAKGRFQFVYVKDGAEAVLKCLGNEKSHGQVYNLCGDEVLDYDMFFRVLADCAGQTENVSGSRRSDSATAEEGRSMADERNVNAAGSKLREVYMTLEEADKQGIPIPFPATAEETELVSNRRSKEELGMIYTPFREGMQKTFHAFARVFRTPGTFK